MRGRKQAGGESSATDRQTSTDAGGRARQHCQPGRSAFLSRLPSKPNHYAMAEDDSDTDEDMAEDFSLEEGVTGWRILKLSDLEEAAV